MENKKENAYLGYSGKVSISTYCGKIKTSERIIKNSGCSPLFKFIAKALCGEFNQEMRPCKIRLFKKYGENEVASLPTTWKFNTDTAISNYIYQNSASIMTTKDGEIVAEYTFRVPYYSIYTTNNSAQIYKIALYPERINSVESDRCAFIGLTSENKTTHEIEWMPDEIIASDSYNNFYEVKWSMVIKNVSSS